MKISKVTCNCTAVTIEVSGPLRPVVACHCKECQKQSGLILGATAAPQDKISVTGADNVQWYDHLGSAKRGFCKKCGCFLLYQMHGDQTISISAGLFGQDDDLAVASQIFTGEKNKATPLLSGVPAYDGPAPSLNDLPDLPEPHWREKISKASERISPYVRKTPTMAISGDDFGLETPVNLKLELLQVSGSFKPRGAFNTILSCDVHPSRIVAASGGNHGAAVAYAANKLRIPSTIFVPKISSPAKTSKIASYGAELQIVGNEYSESLAACKAFQSSTNAMDVHAFATQEAIAGQGTVAKEWLEQEPDLDTLLVAVGGGGLISGIAAWYQNRVKIIGVEPAGAPTLSQALKNGKPVNVSVNSIAADSLGARITGDVNYQICKKYVDTVITIDDNSITNSQRRLLYKYSLVVEPGGATAFAALLSGAYSPARDERVGVLVCGSNVTLESLLPSKT